MPKKKKSFADALNEQISNEFAASQQYVGAAVYYDAATLPRLAHFFYRQALEEREHAMMMIRYLLDTGEAVHITRRNTFARPVVVEPTPSVAGGSPWV